MANTNCLEGVKCPRCGQEDAFAIVTECLALVKDDGIEETMEHEWNDDSRVTCVGCGHRGEMREFTEIETTKRSSE